MSQQRHQQLPQTSLFQELDGNSQLYELQQQMQQFNNFQSQQQTQYIQKQFSQTNSQTNTMQQSFVNEDSSFPSQQQTAGMLSGRFGSAAIPSAATSQPESYRNIPNQSFNQQVVPGMQGKSGYSQQQNVHSQFQTTQGDLMSMMNNIKDGQSIPLQGGNQTDNSMKMPPQNQFYQNPIQSQANNLFQELLKLQAGQFMTAQSPQSTPSAQTGPPAFGQGFMNAAQILATIQQIPQVPQPVQGLNFTLADKQQALPTGQPQNNLMALQQLLNINSNLSQYQSMIDQIEKQGSIPTTVSQGHQIPLKTNSAHIQSPVQPPINSYLNYQASNPQQYIQTGQQSKSAVYLENEAPGNSSLPQPQNYSYLMSHKTPITTNEVGVISENEGNYKHLYEASNHGFDTGSKNTVSSGNIKERNVYNPNSYTATMNDIYKQPQPQSIQTKAYTEDMYEGGYIQRSPQGASNKAFSQFNAAGSALPSRRHEGSPKIAWVSNSNKNDYQYNNTQKLSEEQNSPLRQSANRGYMNDLYGNIGASQNNLLDSSFNRNPTGNFANSGLQGYNNMAASQNSSQILQEHHMNSQTNQPFRSGQQAFNQYSPQGSSYRYDENQVDPANSSINFGKSQRIISHMQNQSQAVNIDDIPIGGGRPKTFEELLEENLKKMGQDPLAAAQYDKYDQNREEADGEDKPQKKEFLKRKSQKIVPAATSQTRKYNYYVDNFDETKKKERSASQIPAPERSVHSSGFNKHDDVQIYSKVPASHLENTPIHNRAVSPLDIAGDRERNSESTHDRQKNVQKKPFLTRGSGKAGGKQGHSNPVVVPKQKQQKQGLNKKGPLLSDDEYPNDFNFAAEQDNKSPKLNHPPGGQSYLSRQNAQSNKRNLEGPLNRNSIDEFEKLEQECNKTQQQQPQAKPGNKRKKKLFDDSDSNDDDEDQQIEEVQAYREEQQNEEQKQRLPQARNASVNMSENEEAPKSNVVKKFFYKEDPSKNQKIPTPAARPTADQNPSTQHSAAMTEHVERVLKAKMEQLDKAIETYNQQNEQAQRLKREYESLLSKSRVDFRDFEAKKKRELEELERLKNDELEKIKKERKTLEQRQRNLQMVNTSNKKEREEIEYLKKELARVQEEAKAKETKMKAQIDRLNKQNEELKVNNRELNEELKHLNEQLRNTQNTQKISSSTSNNAKQQPAEPQNRYTFSTNKSQEQLVQNQQQQPKGILKNKEERPISANHFYNPNQNDEEDDEEPHDEEYQEDEDHQDQDQNHQYSDHEDDHQIKKTAQNTSQISQQLPQNPLPPVNANEEEQEDFDMKFPQVYHNKNPQNMKVVEQIIGHDGKIQRVYENGKKEVIFNNGVKREVFPDGYTIVYFNNHDIKQTYPDQKVVYYFAEAKTTQTTFSDGLQVFKFANNQIEKHFPDGTKEIIFPDGTIKCIFADGEEESIFPDGTIQRIEKNGVKAIEFANGQKDILFPDGTRIREYPDGRVRKTYPDGTCENSFRQQ